MIARSTVPSIGRNRASTASPVTASSRAIKSDVKAAGKASSIDPASADLLVLPVTSMSGKDQKTQGKKHISCPEIASVRISDSYAQAADLAWSDLT